MKKLIFTLCAFITTIGLFAQSTEKEEYEKATAVLRAENDANNEILTSLFRKRDRTEADEKELQQRLGVRDSLGYLIDETILYALEQRKPPFSPRFVIELEKVVSSAYTWSNYYQGNYVENYGKLLERAAKTYERLPEELKVSPPGREMKTYLFPYPKVEVGDQMPDVELPDLDGVMHKEIYSARFLGDGLWSLHRGNAQDKRNL